MITVYTTPGCGRCHVLKTKMDMKGIKYEECQDTDRISELGLTEAPTLEVDGKLLSFGEAIKFINER